MTNDMMAVVEEIVRILNMEKLLPSYRFTVTVSCLRALRQLQRYAHLPSDATLFRQYAQYGLFRDVRVASLDCLVDLIRSQCFACAWLAVLVLSATSDASSMLTLCCLTIHFNYDIENIQFAA